MNEERDLELDTRVAEQITGWRPLEDGSDGWVSPDGNAKHWPGPPEYSLKIADAMNIVEAVRERLRTEGFPLVKMETPLDREKWVVGFGVGFNDSDPQWRGFASDRSLPHAICLAALAIRSFNQ